MYMDACIYILVDGIPTPLKNMKVNGKDDIPYIMENKKCSKPSTGYNTCISTHFNQYNQHINMILEIISMAGHLMTFNGGNNDKSLDLGVAIFRQTNTTTTHLNNMFVI